MVKVRRLLALVLIGACSAMFGYVQASSAPHVYNIEPPPAAIAHPVNVAFTFGHHRSDDVPWCNPNMAKPRRQIGIVWGWAGVHCSVDWKEIWWWVEVNMYSHISHRWVNQGITKVYYNGRPTRFRAATAYAHCRWWGYGKGTNGGKNTERNWQTEIRVDGVLWIDPSNKVKMYDVENTTLHCVGYVAR